MPDINYRKTTQIIKNDQWRKQFDINGFIKIPFLSDQEADKLLEVYQSNFEITQPGFFSSSFSTEVSRKEKLNSEIEFILDTKVSETFRQFKKLGSCFLSKNIGTNGEMPIHQDWTIVDEDLYDSITIWIPLQDVDHRNGALSVIPGSHRFCKAIRSPSIPDSFRSVHPLLKNDLVTIPMKKGEALIFSHALLHASPPNLTDQVRIAVTYGVVDENATLSFYHQSANNVVEQFEVGTDFFYNYNTQIGQRPAFAKSTRIFEYFVKEISPSEYAAMRIRHQYRKNDYMYNMIPIFRDSQRQSLFEKEGFTVLPLLNKNEIADLKSFYESLALSDEKGFGFHVSMDQKDKTLCRTIRQKIWSVIVPRLGEHLLDFKPFVASFVMKEPNPKGIVPAHQDWNFVDNEQLGFTSITCWVALVDTDLDNGALGVIKGSHRFMANVRPSPSPQTPVPLAENMFQLFPYLNIICMKAGEVLMFDNRTFHASPPNTTPHLRLAAGVGVTQKDAQLVHYFLKPDGTKQKILKYNVDEEFFLAYDNDTLSKMYDSGKMIEGYGNPEEVEYSFPKFDSASLVDIIKSSGNDYNVKMTEKLALLYADSAKSESNSKSIQPDTQINKDEKEFVETEWTDNRSFFRKYTPLNIFKEIKSKLVTRN